MVLGCLGSGHVQQGGNDINGVTNLIDLGVLAEAALGPVEEEGDAVTAVVFGAFLTAHAGVEDLGAAGRTVVSGENEDGQKVLSNSKTISISDRAQYVKCQDECGDTTRLDQHMSIKRHSGKQQEQSSSNSTTAADDDVSISNDTTTPDVTVDNEDQQQQDQKLEEDEPAPPNKRLSDRGEYCAIQFFKQDYETIQELIDLNACKFPQCNLALQSILDRRGFK